MDNWADDCIPKALAATENVSKQLFLLKGSSDKDLLEFAMLQLYPHLSDLFYFMDFSDESGGKRWRNIICKKNQILLQFFDNDAEDILVNAHY